MSATLSQQAAAIEAARRIVVGGAKPPRVGGAQAQLLAEQLSAAAETVRAQLEKGAD